MSEEMEIDTIDDFYRAIDSCFRYDDKDRFIKIFRDHGPSTITEDLVRHVIFSGTKKCITAFLTGKASGSPPPVTRNIMQAATYFHPNPYVIDLLMTKCDGGSFCQQNAAGPSPYPFGQILTMICCEIEDHWSKGDSLFKLILLLCHPKLKDYFESVRIIARHSDRVNEIACTRVKDGDLIRFASLLLVAQDKVTAPFDTGLTIKEHFANEVAAANGAPEYMSTLVEADKLLDIFERVGDALSSYHKSISKKASVQMVTKDVTFMFIVAGFSLTAGDLDVSKCFSSRARLALEKSPAYNAIVKARDYDENLRRYPLSTQEPATATQPLTNVVGSVKHNVGSVLHLPRSAISMTPARTFGTFQVGEQMMKKHVGSSMVATQPRSTRKISKPLTKAPSSMRLASMAVYLRKGLKVL